MHNHEKLANGIAKVIICAPTVLALIYLAVAIPKYAAVMTIAPNPADPRTIQTASVDASSLVRTLGLGDNGSTLPPMYAELLVKLTSPSVAGSLQRDIVIMRHLYGNAYDPTTHRLRGSPGIGFYFRQMVSLGAYRYLPPAAQEIAAKLHDRVFVTPVGETNMHEIRVYDKDPAYAIRLLVSLFTLADDNIKHSESARSAEMRSYLENQLKKSSSLTSETMMREMLSQAENHLALSALRQPMAAQIVEEPSVGSAPEVPHFWPVLLFGILISCSLASAYFYYIRIWMPRR
jgi:hypothetical protein